MGYNILIELHISPDVFVTLTFNFLGHKFSIHDTSYKRADSMLSLI